jgi:hypothetical protein
MREGIMEGQGNCAGFVLNKYVGAGMVSTNVESLGDVRIRVIDRRAVASVFDRCK